MCERMTYRAMVLATAVWLAAAPSYATPMPQTALVAAAGSARFELAASPAAFLAGEDATSRATFESVLRNDSGVRGTAAWQAFFAGALQVRHQHADEGETLWFNPVFDSGLLLRWHWGQGTWSAVSARWLLGRQIRSDAPGTWVPLPIQAVDPSRFNGSFTTLASKTLAYAAAADWPAPASVPAGGAELNARLMAAQDALAKMQSTRGYQGSWADAHHLLTRSVIAGPRPGPRLTRILDGLGTLTCGSLRPVSAYRRGSEGWTLVLQSPLSPGIAVLVDFLDPRRGAAEVKNVSVTTYTYRDRRS